MIAVTVILPNYNHSDYLEQRIESILHQTYQDFVIIILDDCSTDNSMVILEKYRLHPKISSIIYNQKNSGNTFSQWEKGIELAQGEWIWIAESDDWCEPSLLEELICGVLHHPDCVVAYCQSAMVRNDQILWTSKVGYLSTYLNGKAFVNDNMLTGNSIFNASMCIFKKQAFFTISPEYTAYQFCGDWLFWIDIALQGDVYISGKTLNYFRKHHNDVSTLAFKQGLLYTEYIKLLSNLKAKNLITSKREAVLYYEKFKHLFLDDRVNMEEKKAILKTFKRFSVSNYYKAFAWFILFRIKSYLKT